MNNIKRIPSASDVLCHGAYIHDDRRWRQIQKIGQQEAYAKCKALVPTELKNNPYLWTNKGFIVLELIDVMVLHMTVAPIERPFYDYKLHVQPGMRAVYLADGNYYLFEYQPSEQDEDDELRKTYNEGQ